MSGPPSPDPNEPQGLRVSAILVAFNQADSLRRAIAALEQSIGRERLEILVVDCGSRDESAQMDREFPSINLLRLPHHLGTARALNIAMRTAKADLIFFVAPGTEVAPDTVQLLADRLEAEPDLIACCPLLIDSQGNPTTPFRSLPSQDQIAAICDGQEFPSASPDLTQESVPVSFPGLDAILVRKVFLRGMNYFDERYGHYWVDAELAMQIHRAGKQIRLYPAIRAVYHPAPDPLRGDSLARTDRYSGGAAFLGKYYGGFAGFLFRMKIALSALIRLQVGLAAGVLGGTKLDGSQAG